MGKDGQRQRSGPADADQDLESEIEDEMMASGRHRLMPREGLVGAHEARKEGLGVVSGTLDTADTANREPVGRGADVAPTRTAERREEERHRRGRALGLVPGGADGEHLRQQRGPAATREALDRIAAEVDSDLKYQAASRETPPVASARPPAQARSWLERNRSGLLLGLGGAAIAGLAVYAAGRRDRW